MLQIDPLKNSCSQKLKHSERKVRLKVFQRAALWKKKLFQKSPLQVQMSTTALLKNLLYLRVTAIVAVKLSS